MSLQQAQCKAPSVVLLFAPSAAQPLSAPLQHGIRFLPPPLPAVPSARLATRVPSTPWHTGREDNRLTTFRRHNRVDRPYLYAGGSTSAPEEFEASGPGHVPFGPSDSAACACSSPGCALRRKTPSFFRVSMGRTCVFPEESGSGKRPKRACGHVVETNPLDYPFSSSDHFLLGAFHVSPQASPYRCWQATHVLHPRRECAYRGRAPATHRGASGRAQRGCGIPLAAHRSFP